MHAGFRLIAAALLTSVLTAAPAAAEEKCQDDTLAGKLHERMKADGKSDADIRDILDSGFKRGIMAGRVASQSGCSDDQVDKALKSLETKVKKG